MKLGKLLALVGGIGAVVVAASATPAFARASSSTAGQAATHLLKFDTMIGNSAPFIGTAGRMRGIDAAPLPWTVESVQGELNANGRLDIDVDGLVLADDPSVPASLRGTNPVPFFAGVVSCLTSGSGGVVRRNLVTANFPASMPGGVAHIHQVVNLPHPCVAPVVFVTSPGPTGFVWFAVTG